MFSSKYHELLENIKKPKKQESAEDIKERMIRKSIKLTGGNENERI